MRHADTSKTGKKHAAAEDAHTGQSSNKQSEQPVVRNIKAIVELERKTLEGRQQMSPISTLFMKLASSPGFIALHVLVFAGWIILNTTDLAFDRRPFDILNLALTFEAIILTSVVLIAQRDLRRLSDLRA